MVAKVKKSLGTWDALAKFPPYFVRIVAKRPGRWAPDDKPLAFSDAEIAIASGLSINRVREISRLEEWATLTISELLAFTAACNFDPTKFSDRNRIAQYENVCKKRKATPFQYLREHPKWESEFLPLVKLLSSRLGFSSASGSISSPAKR